MTDPLIDTGSARPAASKRGSPPIPRAAPPPRAAVGGAGVHGTGQLGCDQESLPDDNRIWLVQWLCAERHCAFATSVVPALGQTFAETIETTLRHARERGLRDVCGICGGRVVPECQPTRFVLDQWAEFITLMIASQRDQLRSRAEMDSLLLTVDSRRERTN